MDTEEGHSERQLQDAAEAVLSLNLGDLERRLDLI
jgi:hypothetical protein